MNEMNEAEVTLLWDLLDHMSDGMNHFPDEYGEEEIAAYVSMRERARLEGGRLKLWWVR